MKQYQKMTIGEFITEKRYELPLSVEIIYYNNQPMNRKIRYHVFTRDYYNKDKDLTTLHIYNVIRGCRNDYMIFVFEELRND